ncbi:MAG: hypothetical protein IT364_07825 [Candidatus Hydrogenedentes bacterium]|nr:hypothetical protein [Candidatus Hydrogenedentota bacterium]
MFIPPHPVDKVLAGSRRGVTMSDSRNERTPNTDTHFRMPDYKSLEKWEARKKQRRRSATLLTR